MANTISNVYVSTFEDYVRQRAQQENARALPYVQVRGEESNDHNWEKLGVSDASLKTTRLQDTPVADTPWSRRVAISQPGITATALKLKIQFRCSLIQIQTFPSHSAIQCVVRKMTLSSQQLRLTL